MPDKKQIPTKQSASRPAKPWTSKKALILSVGCLVAGIAGGYLIRGLQSPTGAETAKAASVAAPLAPVAEAPSPARLKEMADAQAAPLLEKLKADPQNTDLLTSVGNLYYDAKQYPTAIDYYGRTLKLKPSDANVRTDMGTAYWYTGNADSAIAAFNEALKDSPENPNTLFNRGLVRLKGKGDAAGAVADWQKLLAVNPNYAAKNQVERLMAEAKQQIAGKR
ncbi:MAG: tetratricopeptide repeat protein [Terracidiphilus sp.]